MRNDKMYIKHLPPSKVEILDDTPNAGDQTIYKAFKNPSHADAGLNECVIEKTVITNNVGSILIEKFYATNEYAKNDALTFSKTWNNRASLDYALLTY